MPTITTHYDNLKVARNAPPEVIRAAYRSLSQKYHPDKNGNSAESRRVMTILNMAYDVLMDSAKRLEHDQWIKRMEQEASANKATPEVAAHWPAAPDDASPAPPEQQTPFLIALIVWIITLPIKVVVLTTELVCALVLMVWDFITRPLVIILTIAILWFVYSDSLPIPEELQAHSVLSSTPAPSPKAKSTPPRYIRPPTTPYGGAWPAYPSYIEGAGITATGGLSSITVDNTRNSSDVLVKLYSALPAKYNGASLPPPHRQFFIPAHESFQLVEVSAGQYDIRYRDLNDGELAKSESFTLSENEVYGGIEYSNLTMTLYKIENGNMQTYPIPESEF